MCQAHLQLIRPQLLPHSVLQQLDLIPVHIRNAEMPHLTAALQLVKNLTDLLRLHQRIRPVQQQTVQMVCLHPCQNTVHRPSDIIPVKIVEPVMDRALRLNEHLLPQSGLFRQQPAKNLLALPASVDVRMVKEIDPFVQRCFDQCVHILAVHPRDPHAADADAGYFLILSQTQILHNPFSFC